MPLALNSEIYSGEGTLMFSGDRAQLIVGNATTVIAPKSKGTLTWNISTDYAKHSNKTDIRVLSPSPMIQQHEIDTYGTPYSKTSKGGNSYQVDRVAKDNLCSHCGCPPY